MSQVTTFYSYKGGSGRSMAMANVAWALATNGESVLAIDWDLEAPGLHRYFHPFLDDPEQSHSAGLIDRVWDYVDALTSPLSDHADKFMLAQCDDIVQPLDLPFRKKRSAGCLHLLGAGKQDDRYSEKVGGLDWSSFYERFDGEAFLTKLMEWARGRYSHILIDSRTGVADTAGICTAQLPDRLVMCLVYNRQSIEGTAAIARSVKAARLRTSSKFKIDIIPSRVEERGIVEAARTYAAARLADALELDRRDIENSLRRDEIRHFPWCAFEEKLAVFEDAPEERGSLLDAMHGLAQRVSGKNMPIARIDRDLLQTYWRRAAFSDPRIADLEALKELPFDAMGRQLVGWLEEAQQNGEIHAEWLMALGEAAVSAAGRADDRVPSSLRDYLAASGLEIATRAHASDQDMFATRLGLLLLSRSSQLQKSADFEEALHLAVHAKHLFAQDGPVTARWRRARADERIAEILVSQGRLHEAWHSQLAAVEQYRQLGRRKLPLTYGVDVARSACTLAALALRLGRLEDAEHFADEAMRKLFQMGENGAARHSSEAVNVLATRAEIAAQRGADDALARIRQAYLIGQAMIKSPKALEELDWRLHLAEARLNLNQGHAEEALFRLGEMDPAKAPPGGDAQLMESKIEALTSLGRKEQAAEVLLEEVKSGRLSLSQQVLDTLLPMLDETGARDQLLSILIEQISSQHSPATAGAASRRLNPTLLPTRLLRRSSLLGSDER